MSAAPAIADQINPFVVDPGNYFHYGAALVFQWKLDFPPRAARIRLRRGPARGGARPAALRPRRRRRRGRDGLRRASSTGRSASTPTATAVKTAKRWLVMVQEGIDVGTLRGEGPARPGQGLRTQRFNQLNAVMELDMAMSRLAKATGWDAIAPDGT